MSQNQQQTCQRLVTRARAVVRILQPTFPAEAYPGWQLRFSLWEDSAITPDAVKCRVDELFPAELDEFSVTAEGVICVKIRQSRGSNTPDAVQQFVNWLVTPVPVQPLA